MIEGLLEQVRVEASGDRALESVRKLATFHRVQSSPGYDEAAAWLGGELERSGVTPRVEHVHGDGKTRAFGIVQPRGWSCDAATAVLIDGAERKRLCDYAEQKLSLVLRSAPVEGRFPIVALDGGGRSEDYAHTDVAGRVVLSSAPVHRVQRLAVIERGAAGILTDTRRLVPPVRTAEDERDAINYTSFWWSHDMPRGWGFVVSPEVADDLRRRIAEGGSLELEVSIQSKEYDARVPLVSAELPGTIPGDVLLVSHLCHPQPSANDNASGASALLETARVLARMAEHGALRAPRRTIRFLWMPELTGTAAWVAADRSRAMGIAAALNLDMVGEDQDQCGSTLHVERPPLASSSFAEVLLRHIRDRTQDWVTSYSGTGHYSMLRTSEIPYGGGSDHAVLLDPTLGVPCPMLIQWPDRFYHSSHDTPDRTDPSSLAVAVRCAATYAAFLATAGTDETHWLLDLVTRTMRREAIDVHDRQDPTRAAEAVRVRGHASIQSVARMLDDPVRIAGARDMFESFWDAETRPLRTGKHASAGVRAEATPGARCPRRRSAGPLEFHAHLLPGHDRLGAAERLELDGIFEAIPGGRLTVDLAWMNCNGQRSLDEIARLIWLETGVDVPVGDGAAATLGGLFEAFEKLGMVSFKHDEETAWTSAAPDTATR